MSGEEEATTCDGCVDPILYGQTCYLVHTGRTWDCPGDPDDGKPIAEVLCGSCYTGPAKGSEPQKVVLR